MRVEQRDTLKRKRRDEQQQNVARKKQAAEELSAAKAARRQELAETAAVQGDADESELSEDEEVESGGKCEQGEFGDGLFPRGREELGSAAAEMGRGVDGGAGSASEPEDVMEESEEEGEEDDE